MISYEKITEQAKRALGLVGVSILDEIVYIPEDTECIISGETFLYRFKYLLGSAYRYILLFEEKGVIDVPLDFEELDRKLRLFV